MVGPLLESVRRRVRLQAAMEGATSAAVLAAAAAAVAIYLWRLGVVSRHGLSVALLVGASVIVAGGVWRAVRRIPLQRAAKLIDRTHTLHDRLGSALAFSGEPAPTAFMDAAIADAGEAARLVDVRRAAPFSRPRSLGPALLVATVAAIVAMLHFPARAVVVIVTPPGAPRLVVDPELLQPERDAVQQLEQDAIDSGDQQTKALANDLKKLLDQLDDQQLTRKQVFDKLAEIEKKLQANDGDFEELKKQLKKAGAELSKDKLTRETGDALVKEDLQKAREELEKLAEDAQKLDEKKREELAQSLERTAKQQPEKSAEDKQREQREKQLKEEERKLKKELAEKPNDKELERRLQRNQRELEKMEREKDQHAEQKRQLERLQRDLQKAAEQLRQKLSPQAAEALRRAAQQMGQMQDEIRKLGNSGKAQMQIAELKEMLRRAGTSQQPGENGNPSKGSASMGEQRGDQGQGQGNNGKGKNGKNGQGGEKSLARDFNNRAGGDKVLILGDKGGDGNVILPLPGNGGGGPPPGDGKGGGQGDKLPGDGIGDQHDPHVMGDPTKLASKRVESKVTGKEGAGPSKSETIMGSAEKGFASRNYRRVYSDYSSVVEEVMSKERVPPGYRYYIKRYFQLIKPRD